MIVMTRAWANCPQEYKDFDDYLDQESAGLKKYVNDYLKQYRLEHESFTLDAEDRQFITDYVKINGKPSYTVNPDGSYDSVRLSNLLINAVAAKYNL